MPNEHGYAQAKACHEHIKEFLAAYSMDWDRYEELLEDKDDEDVVWDEETTEEFEELQAMAGDLASQDDVLQQIYEYPLELTVLKDTRGTGGEFRILLVTGGPAVRISGHFDEDGEPVQAWLEHQDWGTSWNRYNSDENVLLEFAQKFYFN